MKMSIKTLLGTLAGSAVIAVAFGIGIPSTSVQAADARAPIDPMVFAQGARLWAETCSRCHSMRDPQELRDDQWRIAVSHMRVRSGITKSEAEAIVTFLQESN